MKGFQMATESQFHSPEMLNPEYDVAHENSATENARIAKEEKRNMMQDFGHVDAEEFE